MKQFLEELKFRVLSSRWKVFKKKYLLPEIALKDLGFSPKVLYPRIMEEICLPPFRGDTNFDDFSALFSILEFMKPKLILELGTGYGNTTANICASFDSRVITVNALPEQISGRVTTYSLTQEDIGRVYRVNGFSERVVQVYEDTKKMNLAELVTGKSIDFAIVDGCHDSDFVLSDFLSIFPFMAHGSVVVLHDTHPSMEKHYLDSYIACMYLRKVGHNIKHVENTSWAIWFAKDAVVPRNFVEKVTHSITTILDLCIFGSRQNDLLRIRRHAKKILRK